MMMMMILKDRNEGRDNITSRVDDQTTDNVEDMDTNLSSACVCVFVLSMVVWCAWSR